MKKSIHKIISILLSLVMVIGVIAFNTGLISADAATFDDINQAGVFFKQSTSGPCVLDSCAMMIRRVLIATGSADWASVTENSLKGTACYSGWSVSHSFDYKGVSVRHEWFDQSAATLQSLLAQHPEGIVLYSASKGHAVLVTDYTNGSFYAADPSTGAASGRILFSQVTRVTVSNASAYWYVASPTVTLSLGDKPTSVWIRASAATVKAGEQLTFTYGAQNAESYALSYTLNGKTTTVPLGSAAQYATAFDSPGTYTVHITGSNRFGSTDSQDIVITVYDLDASLQSISVRTSPTKTTYTVGETLDVTGLTLSAKYTNGSDMTVTSGFTCTPTVLNTAGRQTVTVAYGGKTTTFVVTATGSTASSGQAGVRSVLLSDTTIYLNGKTKLKPVITVEGDVKYTVSYETSDPTIAEVTNEGEITGASEGIATVTVTVTDEAGNAAADSCMVVVRCSVFQLLVRVVRFIWTWIRSLTAQA